jgi:hypothetical protein
VTPSTSVAPLALPAGSRLVHIGPHKTGTTALQAAFHAAREDLRAQGVRYAGRGRHPMSAVLAVTGRPSVTGTEPPPIRLWGSLLGEIRGAAEPRVVLSSEFFADAPAEAIPRIVTDLDPARIQVVVTLRPLARILASQWQQHVQGGLQQSFDAWLGSTFRAHDKGTATMFWRRHRHDALIARWAEVAGRERITVVVVDERDHAFLMRAFEQLVGVREGTLVAVPDLSNRSLTLPEVEALRAFNVAYKAEDLGKAIYAKAIRFGAARYLRERTPASDEPRVETPQWALDQAVEISTEMVANIAASGVRVVGDLDSLAARQRSRLEAEQQALPCIAPEIATRLAMGIVISSGLARRSRQAADGQHVEEVELARVSSRDMAVTVVRRARGTVLRRLRPRRSAS